MLKQNFLKQKLERGEAVLGTWIMIPSMVTADIIASTGIDFMILDAEHGPLSFETVQSMAIACESHQVSPMMRLGAINEADILKALDVGVHGIQIPNICSCEEVKKIVAMAKYPPLGNRGYSPFTRAGNYSIESATVLTERANKNTLLAINVEGKEAFDDIDNILSVDGLDIVFVGLFDLSKALGIPGQVDHPLVLGYLETLARKISSAGKYAGTISTSKEKIDEYLNMGLKYIVHLVDCEMLRNSYADITLHFKKQKES